MSGARYADRVQETSATGGTGTLTLAGAVAGFQSFATAFPDTSTVVKYTITDGTLWETGVGLYTLSGTTLARTAVAVLDGSSGRGVLVNFTGTQNVWNDQPAALIADTGLTISLANCQVFQ